MSILQRMKYRNFLHFNDRRLAIIKVQKPNDVTETFLLHRLVLTKIDDLEATQSSIFVTS